MALLEERLGLFNDHEAFPPVGGEAHHQIESLPYGRVTPRSGVADLQQSDGLSVSYYPYVELIQDHLAHGRILAAQKLFEFARDLIPSDSKLAKALAPPKIKKSDRRDVDRSAEFHWLDMNSGRFRGQWVALVGDNLVASAESLDELLSTLRASPPPGKPLIHHLD